ncbi:DnaT-like ssDNA-binding protein [Variovorax ginsengisoli]|uniref:Putative DnaT-like domain-containing protein n=1 Tax=Variovorax ginsengisoli TaxID=363844 RepID=A0ABT8S0A6_9BURK|nr:DnaT-like ssDNA-binding protein [Variovorax ginsengisoli]MDN8612793.1 hypothetical protein [Variovorax ginsengisoli]MDO1531963.1 hypothetical protein [Variovorax ginsengisoli]
MTLIVAPTVGAESYISVAGATAYHLARGNAAWAAVVDDTTREQLLRKATDYMVQAYGQRWKGDRVTPTQSLDWPRYGVYVNNFCIDSTTVPAAVANACAELALRAITAPSLFPDVGRLKAKVKVGPIETEYVQGTSGLTRYTAVDNMLAAYLGAGGNLIPVVRA